MFDATAPTCNDTLKLVKSGKCPLSPSVKMQSTTVLCCWPDATIAICCNQLNAAVCEPLVERITCVGTVPPNKSSESSRRDGFIEVSVDNGDFIGRAFPTLEPLFRDYEGAANEAFG